MNEVVVAEEWRENFRMSRGNYHGLNVLLTGACSKRDEAVAPPIKRCSVDAEHIIRFHVWTENFCSFFAPKVAFPNLSGIRESNFQVVFSSENRPLRTVLNNTQIASESFENQGEICRCFTRYFN